MAFAFLCLRTLLITLLLLCAGELGFKVVRCFTHSHAITVTSLCCYCYYAGYEFIDLTYNAEHEVFCYICRERDTGRLVVAFR
jgi:hypothetical protein